VLTRANSLAPSFARTHADLTGFQTPSEPLTALVVTQEDVLLVTRQLEWSNSTRCPADVGLAVDCYSEEQEPAEFLASAALGLMGNLGGDVGMELSSRRLAPAEFSTLVNLLPQDMSIVSSGIAASLRLVKSDEELAQSRKAAMYSFEVRPALTHNPNQASLER
jgi:Xaa-Pro aminopeptidase